MSGRSLTVVCDVKPATPLVKCCSVLECVTVGPACEALSKCLLILRNIKT